MAGRPLTALLIPVIAVVYSFWKEFNRAIDVMMRVIIYWCKTGTNKAVSWWSEQDSRTKGIILVGFLIVAIIGIAIFAGISHSNQKRILLAEISKADTAQTEGRWKEAITLYQRLYEKKPDNSSFKDALAVCQYMIEAEASENKGDLDGAIVNCQNARNLEPVSTFVELIDSKIENLNRKIAKIKSLLSESKALKNKNEFNKSLGCIAEVLNLNPGNAEAKQLQVELTGLIKKQEEDAEKQNRFRNLMAEGAAYEAKKDLVKAIETYEKALAIIPDNTEGKQRRAEVALLVEKQKKETQVKINQLLSYAKTNDNKENYIVALKTLKEVLNLVPNHTEAQELYDKILSSYISTDIGWWLSNAKTTAANIDDTNQKAVIYSDIVEIQAKAGDIDGAKTTVLSISNADIKARAYNSIMVAQAKVGDVTGADATAAKIMGFDKDSLLLKSEAYCHIAKTYAKNGNKTAAQYAFGQAKAIANAIRDDFTMSLAYSKIAEAQVELNDIAGAKVTSANLNKDNFFQYVIYQNIVANQIKAGEIDKAKNSAEEIGNNFLKAKAFAIIAEFLMNNGNIKKVKVLAENVENSETKDSIYEVIVKTQLDGGAIIDAMETASNMSDSYIKNNAYCAIVNAQAISGDLIGAEATAAKLKPNECRFDAYNLIAKAKAKKGDLKGSHETFMKSRTMIETFISQFEHKKDFINQYKPKVYIKIARAQVWIQDITGAKITASSITDSKSKASAYGAIAEVQVEMGDIAGAEATAESIGDSELKTLAYIAIAKAQLTAGSFSEAMITATKIGDHCRRKETFDSIVNAKAKTSTPYTLLFWIESLKNDQSRVYAYLYVAASLIAKSQN